MTAHTLASRRINESSGVGEVPKLDHHVVGKLPEGAKWRHTSFDERRRREINGLLMFH